MPRPCCSASAAAPCWPTTAARSICTCRRCGNSRRCSCPTRPPSWATTACRMRRRNCARMSTTWACACPTCTTTAPACVASTATAPRSPTWPATGAGVSRKWPTTGARSSAWRWRRLKTRASTPFCCASTRAWRTRCCACTRARRRAPATRPHTRACGTAWPCSRAPCSTLNTATPTRTCFISASASTRRWPRANRAHKRWPASRSRAWRASAARATSCPMCFSPTPRWTTATTTATCGFTLRPATKKRASSRRARATPRPTCPACRHATTPSGTTRARPGGPTG